MSVKAWIAIDRLQARSLLGPIQVWLDQWEQAVKESRAAFREDIKRSGRYGPEMYTTGIARSKCMELEKKIADSLTAVWKLAIDGDSVRQGYIAEMTILLLRHDLGFVVRNSFNTPKVEVVDLQHNRRGVFFLTFNRIEKEGIDAC